MSAIRNLVATPFDLLAAVLFTSDFSIHRAALIPIAVVATRVRHSLDTNSDIYRLTDDVWSLADVIDVTDEVRAVASKM